MAVQSYTTTASLKTRLGITDSTDDTLLGVLVAATNDWIEEYVGRPIGPLTGQTYTFDGYSAYNSWDALFVRQMPGGQSLYIRQGIRTLTSFTIADTTGGTPVTGTNSDLILWPRIQDRRTNWPAFEIRFVDIPTGPVNYFPLGYGNISITGDYGWAAIPAKISEIADTILVRMWHARKSGQTDIVGNDETGAPMVSRYVASEDRAALKDYKVDRVAIG